MGHLDACVALNYDVLLKDKKECLLIDSSSMKQMCSIISTKKESVLIDSTFYVLNICKLRMYGGNNCLPFCHLVLYVNILLR